MIPFRFRQVVILLYLLPGIVNALAQVSKSDSLQQILAHEEDQKRRIDLLLNLKDLNEDTSLNLPFSIRLFREAAALHDTYAMSVAVEPIIARYASYQEKTDSLIYYTRTLHEMMPGTPEEGFDNYVEMEISYRRLRDEYDQQRQLAMAQEILQWTDSLTATTPNIYEQTKRLVLRGYAAMVVMNIEKGISHTFPLQSDTWQKAYDLTRKMPNLHVRKAYADTIFFLLSCAYNEAADLPKQQIFTNEFITLLDSCNALSNKARRPYLYTYDDYSLPYQQLICGALNYQDQALAKQYFQTFRTRMLSARAEDLPRNKRYIYDNGYLTYGIIGDYATSLQYNDSLLQLISQNQFTIPAQQVVTLHFNRSKLLYWLKQFDASYAAFQQTWAIQDSLLTAERRERVSTIQRSHDMDRLLLAETRAVIRNRRIVTGSFIGIALLLIGLGIYQYITLRNNKKVQADILRHSRKSQESEQMKSTFVNSICGGIGPPLDAICSSASNLMIAGPKSPENTVQLDQIRKNTKLLLSTLDNMLEAANLDSLTEHLQLSDLDINELCQSEFLSFSALHQDADIEYRIEAPETECRAVTHAKYLTLVIRALLDNAAKYTHQGSITLRYGIQDTLLQISVTDTGCGIPAEVRKNIFQPMQEHTITSSGLNLVLCHMIAERLWGSIRLDDTYTQGACFIFTIPQKP